jgi:hypothetical protein
MESTPRYAVLVVAAWVGIVVAMTMSAGAADQPAGGVRVSSGEHFLAAPSPARTPPGSQSPVISPAR